MCNNILRRKAYDYLLQWKQRSQGRTAIMVDDSDKLYCDGSKLLTSHFFPVSGGRHMEGFLEAFLKVALT